MSTDVTFKGTNAAGVERIIRLYERQITNALPDLIKPDRFIATCANIISIKPSIQECAPTTILGSILQASIVGLELHPSLGQAALIPYDKKCQFQIQFQGIISLMSRRSDEVTNPVTNVHADVVYERDEFHHKQGISPVLDHTKYIGGDPGEMYCAYCIVYFRYGQPKFHIMGKTEIEDIRDKYSKSYKCDIRKKTTFSGWTTRPGEMWKKTVIHNIRKQIPLPPFVQKALATDNSIIRIDNFEKGELSYEAIERDMQIENGSNQHLPDVVDSKKSAQLAERLKQKVDASKTPATQRQPAPAKSTGENPPDNTDKPKKVAESANTDVAPSEETEFVNNWKEQPFDVLNEKYMELRESTGLSIQKAFSMLQEKSAKDDPLKNMKNAPANFKNLYEFSVDAAVRLLYWMKEN